MELLEGVSRYSQPASPPLIPVSKGSEQGGRRPPRRPGLYEEGYAILFCLILYILIRFYVFSP